MSEPSYLLLPKPGLAPEQLDAFLRGLGLQRVTDVEQQTRLWRWSDGAKPAPCAVEYREDHSLGQRLLYTRGPRAGALQSRCAEYWPCWSTAEALTLAARASNPADKVATLAPLAALLEADAASGPQISAVLRARLGDEAVAVRRAALLVAASLPAAVGSALLQAMVGDPQLGEATRRYLTAGTTAAQYEAANFEAADPAALLQRAEVALRDGALAWAGRLIARALELSPLLSSAYLLRAQVSAAEGRVWPALIDVTTALAIARRQGVHLQAMQTLQTTLRAQLLAVSTPPTVAVELQAVALLALLLRHGRLHEVEEIAQTLLPLPGRAPLWWLATGLARWERGRYERAVEALEAALAAEPDFPAARFLLGRCRRELGDVEGALDDFTRLDPVAGERPARPSLLAAYADELLGTQAPWNAREHAFARVQLLRERGRLVEALAVITELLRREPAAADALLAQGILFAELAQPAAALLVLDQARAALRPEERLLAEEDPLGTLQWHRAEVLNRLGDQEGAAAASGIARRLGVETVPHTAPAVAPDRAESVARTAPALDPDHAESVTLTASALDPDRAVLLEPDRAAAAYAELRHLAQQSLLQDDFGAAVVAAGVSPSAEGSVDATVVRAALREQLAELFVAALGALDNSADADTCRALISRAWRGLTATQPACPAGDARRRSAHDRRQRSEHARRHSDTRGLPVKRTLSCPRQEGSLWAPPPAFPDLIDARAARVLDGVIAT